MSQAYNNSSIDLELQVRLMNLVMGEASDFERDQLQLLMEQRTELVAYYQHLEHLHGLLCVVGAEEPSMDVDPLSADIAEKKDTDSTHTVSKDTVSKDTVNKDTDNTPTEGLAVARRSAPAGTRGNQWRVGEFSTKGFSGKSCEP
jgi:hypothetical protein